MGHAKPLLEVIKDASITKLAPQELCWSFRFRRNFLLWRREGGGPDSQNFASELVGKFRNERKALRAIALTADSSILTNIANDFSYKFIFSRQIQALGKEGDILFSISSSGQSPNVIEAIKAANNLNLTTISLLGKGGGKAMDISQSSILIPSSVWKFSIKVARTLGNARELPFNV